MNGKTISLLLAGALAATITCAQTPAPSPGQAPARTTTSARSGIVRGSVKDDTGGVIPGAVVTLANQTGTVQTVHTTADGSYTFRGVAPGAYTVSATYAGLQQEGMTNVNVAAGQAVAATSS